MFKTKWKIINKKNKPEPANDESNIFCVKELIKRLQKENQQLKEKLDKKIDGKIYSLEDIYCYIYDLKKEKDLYKNRLNEIRNCINLELKQRQSNLSIAMQLKLLKLSEILNKDKKEIE